MGKAKNRLSQRTDDEMYFYVRRVPASVARFDARKTIRISLGTRELAEAAVKAKAIDEENERFWAALLNGADGASATEKYRSALEIVRTMGFAFRTKMELAEGPLPDLLKRVEAVQDEQPQSPVVAAALGLVELPKARMSGLWELYEQHERVALSNLSPNQMRKHRVGRQRAIKDWVTIIGDSVLDEITRADVLKFRGHWTNRVTAGEVLLVSANRIFSDLKGMMTVASDALDRDYTTIFRKVAIRNKKTRRKEKERTRPSYSSAFVQNRILAPGALDGMNDDAKLIIYGIIETGMGASEICNLRGHGIDIFPFDPIPYVKIEERDDREQKTVYRYRKIPLVGCSLWALRQAPNGFPKYRDKGDTLSNTLNKFFRENGLRETPKHSVYCLRHTFQDRILAGNALDRVQSDLMGHEFEREAYGEGASLEQMQEVLLRVMFKWEPPQRSPANGT